MSITEILFWFLSAMALGAALMMVTSKNPVYSVLWLIVVFFAISGHYILLNAQFLAIVNIIVYAGAIMVLQKNQWSKIAGAIAGGSLMLVFVAAIRQTEALQTQQVNMGGETGLIHLLGKVLFTDYVLPFEISSVLFLSAMVGAVVIGKKGD